MTQALCSAHPPKRKFYLPPIVASTYIYLSSVDARGFRKYEPESGSMRTYFGGIETTNLASGSSPTLETRDVSYLLTFTYSFLSVAMS